MRDIMRFMNNLSTSMCTFSLRHYIHFFCHQLLMRFFLNFFFFLFFSFFMLLLSHTMHILTHRTKKNIYRTEYFIHIRTHIPFMCFIQFLFMNHALYHFRHHRQIFHFIFMYVLCCLMGKLTKKNYNFF